MSTHISHGERHHVCRTWSSVLCSSAPSTGLSLQVSLRTYCVQGTTEVLYGVSVSTHWQKDGLLRGEVYEY